MITLLPAYRLAFLDIYLLHHARLTGTEFVLHLHCLKYRNHLSRLDSVCCFLEHLTTKPGMTAVIAPALSAADSVPAFRMLGFFSTSPSGS